MRLALLLLLFALPARAAGPEAAVTAALADCQRLPADQQQHTRYLSLYYLSDKDTLARWENVLAFWSNSLSDQPDLARPRRVAPGLWAVRLDDYGWRSKTWEKLADVEPYFHVNILAVKVEERDEDQEWGEWQDGYGRPVQQGSYGARWVKTETKKIKRRVERKVKTAAAAPWLPSAEIASLIALTQSQVPLVRADWWIFQTGQQKDRVAGYYDFLNLGNKEEDFQRLVGVDIKAARRVKRELRAVVGRSGVTLNNREIQELDAITGPYWRSLDYAANADVKNPLRLLDGDAQFDASEQYGVLPNGLFAYGLFNNKGERQDTAPDNIALDKTATGNDLRIHPRNCVWCHVEGLRPVNDWARRTYTPPFSLDSPDYRLQLRLRQLYMGNLTRKLKQGNDAYAETLATLNGEKWTAAANAKAWRQNWDEYAEADVGVAELAREMGVKEEWLTAALRTAAAGPVKLDPVLAGMLQGLPARREHAEEVYPIAWGILGNKP
jgi:hypothetical protein